MSETRYEGDQPRSSYAGGNSLERFLALPLEMRLSLILERSFAPWCTHANDGVNLVYDHATLMTGRIVKQILAVEETDSLPDFEIFSTRMVLNIETGYDAFDPDAGAFQKKSANESAKEDGHLFLIETAVRAMSSSDAPFDPRYLVPQDPNQVTKLSAQFGHIFSTQFRFWSEDHADFGSRLAAFHAQMADFPQVSLVEKHLSVSLRKTNRFRLKRKVLDFFQTPVRAIAIGLDW